MLHSRVLNFILFYLRADTAYSVHSPKVYRLAREVLDNYTGVEHAPQKDITHHSHTVSTEGLHNHDASPLKAGYSRFMAKIADVLSPGGSQSMNCLACAELKDGDRHGTGEAAPIVWYFAGATDTGFSESKQVSRFVFYNSLWVDDPEMDVVLAGLLTCSGVIIGNKHSCKSSAQLWNRLRSVACSGYFVDMYHTGVYIPNARQRFPVYTRLIPSRWKPVSPAQFFPGIKAASK